MYKGRVKYIEQTWKACTRINMLSTPTARTRKGITSIMIRVAGTPAKQNIPNDDSTETITINTPARPREIFEST